MKFRFGCHVWVQQMSEIFFTTQRENLYLQVAM